jgi:hypothetical protein
MITPRSKIIRPLPTSFIDYLHSDGVFIPDGSENLLVGVLFEAETYTNV